MENTIGWIGNFFLIAMVIVSSFVNFADANKIVGYNIITSTLIYYTIYRKILNNYFYVYPGIKNSWRKIQLSQTGIEKFKWT